jgi:integrase
MSHLYRRDRIYWLAFYKNGELFRRSLKTKDRETAKYLASKISQEITEGKYININYNPACDKILEEYEQATEHYKVKKTLKDDSARIKNFLSLSGINTLKQIDEKKFQDYLNRRINNDKISLNSANRYISTIKAWLNFAVRRKYIFDNPIKDLKKYPIPRNPPKYLTQDEVKRILDAAKGTRIYHAIFIGLYTGMRQREVSSLEWQDINFEANTITIQNKGWFTTKSKKFRVIPLHDKLKEILLPLKKETGKCFDLTNYRKIFPEVIKQAGLKNIGFHHFRHTCASNLALAGVDLYTISQVLGHSNITVTQQYSHLTKDHLRVAIEKLKF